MFDVPTAPEMALPIRQFSLLRDRWADVFPWRNAKHLSGASLSITEIYLAHRAWNLDLAGHLEVIHTGQTYTSAPLGDCDSSGHQSGAITF